MSTKLTIFVLLVLATSALASTRRLGGAQSNLSGSKLTSTHRNNAATLMKSLGETGVAAMELLHYGTQVVAGENVTMVFKNTALGRAQDHWFLCARVYKHFSKTVKPKMSIHKWSHTEAAAKKACDISNRRPGGGSQTNLSGSKITSSQLTNATGLMTSLKESRIGMMQLLHYGTQTVAGQNFTMVWKNNALGRESTPNDNFLCARVYKHFSPQVKPKMSIHKWFRTEAEAKTACNINRRLQAGGQHNFSGANVTVTHKASATKLMKEVRPQGLDQMELMSYGTQTVAGKNVFMVWKNNAIGIESTGKFLCVKVFKSFQADVAPKVTIDQWFNSEQKANTMCGI